MFCLDPFKGSNQYHVLLLILYAVDMYYLHYGYLGLYAFSAVDQRLVIINKLQLHYIYYINYGHDYRDSHIRIIAHSQFIVYAVLV